MAQIKIYGVRRRIEARVSALSDATHESMVQCLALPEDKRFHRFIPLGEEEFIYPPDRSEDYTIIEISMFEGRSLEAKKDLINTLFAAVAEKAGIRPQDVEITLFETPKSNWGIRGVPADELALGYEVAPE